MIKAILATGLNGEIGQNGDMPWGRSLPKDLEYFKKVTEGGMLTFGRKTSESLPFKKGVFPNRSNNVITSNEDLWDLNYYESTFEFYNWWEDLETIKHHMKICADQGETTWVVGGASIYEQLWQMVNEVHLTTVHNTYPEADTFFPPDLSNFEKVGEPVDVSSGDLEASVQVWVRVK